MTGYKFEEALRLLIKYMQDDDPKKPALFHSVRVGSFLWNKWYSEDIQIAWLFHDALEDTDISEEDIETHFWETVLEIVKANSKDMSLPKDQRLEDIVVRCSNHSEAALIVKIGDIYDNYLFYSQIWDLWEIERCKRIAGYIVKHKKESYRDPIFSLLDFGK